MNRRDGLKILLAAVLAPLAMAGGPLRRALAAGDEGANPVPFRWRVPVVHFEAVEQSLDYDGTVAEEKDKKGALVFVIVGAVLIPYLAKSILELMRQVENGGVVIDACGEAVDIETDKQMPYGMVVVRSCKDADVRVFRDEIESPSELAGFIEKAMGAN